MRRRTAQKQEEKVRQIRVRTDEVYGGVVTGRAEESVSLHELAASIARRGLLQPIVLRRSTQCGRYALVCGARRLAACRMLGMKEIDAVLIDADAQEGAACFMEEHLLRSAPCAMEETAALETAGEAALIDSAQMERRIRMRRRLMHLEPRTKEIVRRYALSAEQAASLALIRDAARQEEAALIIGQRALTPAQARRLAVGPSVQQEGTDGGRKRATKAALAEIYALARRLRAQGMEVSVTVHSQEGGMCIQFLLKNGEKVNNRQENGKE